MKVGISKITVPDYYERTDVDDDSIYTTSNKYFRYYLNLSYLIALMTASEKFNEYL